MVATTARCGQWYRRSVVANTKNIVVRWSNLIILVLRILDRISVLHVEEKLVMR